MSDDLNSPILAAIAGLSAKLGQFHDELRVELGGVRGELAQVRAELAQVRAELGQVRDELRAELSQVRSEVMARIDRLQDRMVAHHEADVVNFGAAERAERIAMTTRADVTTLGEQINALVRLVRNLSDRLEAVEDKR